MRHARGWARCAADPEIRWRIKPADTARSSRACSWACSRSAAPHVALGGTLAYATCTVTREENNGVVKAFLESEAGAGFKLAPVNGRSCVATRLSPGSSDAHFADPFRAHRVKPPRARCRPTLSEEVRAAYGGEGMRFCGA